MGCGREGLQRSSEELQVAVHHSRTLHKDFKKVCDRVWSRVLPDMDAATEICNQGIASAAKRRQQESRAR